ncbi:MAG: glutamate 5-kinase [Bacillota bacterium]|nr:glutamate 5-kinase [Bacillota bacterium]
MGFYKRIVVKIGSSSLTYENGRLNFGFLDHFVRTLADIRNSGTEVVLVTSGAISVGAARLHLHERPKDTPTKQAAAAVGQCELMYVYDKIFSEYGHKVAQVLLTRDVVDEEHRMDNVINTLNRLIELGTIPVINENDTVAIEEIEFGDNDTLSAVVSKLVGADALILMSDIDGLYDKDPYKNPDAVRIDVVSEINEDILKLGGGVSSNQGTGGMATKLSAAEIAFANNFDMFIVSSKSPLILYDILEKKQGGTYFQVRKD